MHEEVSFDQQEQKFDCLICGKEFENSLNILMCYSKHFEFELVNMVGKLLEKKTKEGQELKNNTNHRCPICATRCNDFESLSCHIGGFHLLVNDILVREGLEPMVPTQFEVDEFLDAREDF